EFKWVEGGKGEMEGGGEEVMEGWWEVGEKKGIMWIEEVGGGGLWKGLGEVVKDGGRGGVLKGGEVGVEEEYSVV
ncbi:hypothetical protein, partial [Neisseria sicca]|uniref:hypothetical protein n=1 Tax=Neisseria sicca TaxID=490 RepID=UPI001C999F08